MSADASKILAGVSAGAGNALVSMGNVGATMPTTATAALGTGLYNMGWVSTDGVKKAIKVDSQEIGAFGASGPVRTLKTSQVTTFQMAFLESSPNVIEVYNELPLNSLVIANTTGSFDFTEGSARTQRYCMVIDAIDGNNHIRGVAPTCEVTDKDDYSISGGDAIQYGVTLTAYPGGDGVAVHWYYVVDALKSA